jgi:hypothetical protein
MKKIHTIGLTAATAASLILTPGASAATDPKGTYPPPPPPRSERTTHQRRLEFLALVLDTTPSQLEADLEVRSGEIKDSSETQSSA